MKENNNNINYSNFIKELAKTLKDADLNEIEFNHDLNQSTVHIKIKKDKEIIQQHIASQPPVFISNSPNTPHLNSQTNFIPSEEHTNNNDLSNHPGAILSPMVGIIYTSPGPDMEDFVKVGSMVQEGDTVLLIEAMKVFNPVKAPKSGKITQILVKSQQPIEYGEVLLIIE